MILGLTGRNGAGKTTVAEFLATRGFDSLSLSDIIRDSLKQSGLEVVRSNLIEMGNNLRREFGPAVLAERTAQKLDPDKNYVIDSVRSPFEARRLKELPDFALIHVAADLKLRFERCRARNREGAEARLEDFIRTEEREMANADPAAQNLDATAALADYTLENNGSVESLHVQVAGLFKDAAAKLTRPSWDEYFMNIAKVVASRSNCIKRKVAAVIVKDKRIISTGYNGTPRGTKNCNEGGCPRCNAFGASGAGLGECLCSHAEENAITQSAYHGVSLRGATLYTTFSPCLICTKMIINAGLHEVVFRSRYSLDRMELDLLEQAGIVVRTQGEPLRTAALNGQPKASKP